MAFRREAFERAGLFDERLGAGASGCSDDSEYWHRFMTAGALCRYEPSAVAFHYYRRDMVGPRKQLHSYASGYASALLVQYERSGNFGNLTRLLIILPRHYLND